MIGGEVNLASRLESNAKTGQILISQETYALIKKEIFCEKKEEINVKGIVHKIQTYQVIDSLKKIKKNSLLFNKEYSGFSLNVDLNISKKEKVISSLENILKTIKKSF